MSSLEQIRIHHGPLNKLLHNLHSLYIPCRRQSNTLERSTPLLIRTPISTVSSATCAARITSHGVPSPPELPLFSLPSVIHSFSMEGRKGVRRVVHPRAVDANESAGFAHGYQEGSLQSRSRKNKTAARIGNISRHEILAEGSPSGGINQCCPVQNQYSSPISESLTSFQERQEQGSGSGRSQRLQVAVSDKKCYRRTIHCTTGRTKSRQNGLFCARQFQDREGGFFQQRRGYLRYGDQNYPAHTGPPPFIPMDVI